MALSAHERNLLEQLEKQFSDEAPEFAAAMEPEPARSGNALRILAGAAGRNHENSEEPAFF